MHPLPQLMCKNTVEKWAVERLGLTVEASLKYDMLDDDSRLSDLYAWRELTSSVHLPFSLADRRLNIAALDDTWRQHSLDTLTRSLEIASRLDARRVVIHSAPRYWDGQTVGEYDRLIEGLRQIAASAGRYDLTVCLENNRTYWDGCDPTQGPESIDRSGINAYFGVEPHEWIAQVANAGAQNLHLCLDTSHAVTTAQTATSFDRRVAVMDEFLAAGDRIIHVHWNDNYLFDTRGRKDSHRPLGQGSLPLDFQRRVSCLNASFHLERVLNASQLVEEMSYIDAL